MSAETPPTSNQAPNQAAHLAPDCHEGSGHTPAYERLCGDFHANQASPSASSAATPADSPDAPSSAPTAVTSPPLFAATLAALEAAINGYLALDPEGASRLAPLAGRIIALEFTGFGQRLYFIPGNQGFQLFGDYAAEPDCVIRGTPWGLAGLGLPGLSPGKRKEDILFSGQVQIEGDSGLAQRFGDCLAGIRIDWEEQLSRLTGDPLAHALGTQVRAAGRWGQRTLDHLGLDLQEYLQEEGRLLPTRYELELFLDAVDRLRDDSERLAARVERLRRHLTGQQTPQRPPESPRRQASAIGPGESGGPSGLGGSRGPGGLQPRGERPTTPDTLPDGDLPPC